VIVDAIIAVVFVMDNYKQPEDPSLLPFERLHDQLLLAGKLLALVAMTWESRP